MNTRRKHPKLVEEEIEELPAPAGSEASEESDGPQHRRFLLKRDLNKRLDHWLRDKFPSLSRSRLQKLINEGAVLVNGRAPKSSTSLRLGDQVEVQVPPPSIKEFEPQEMPLDILYEDEYFIVINKQADLVVHPARSNTSGTLVNGLAHYFKDVAPNGLEALSSIGIDEFRPGIVHRLDKDTTGVILVAKTDIVHGKLSKQWENRTVQKYYLAIVHNEMTPPGGVIDEPIGVHTSVKEAYSVRHDSAGKPSVTLYRVREVFKDFSLVELELKTGRTHQIRVHLTYMGFPICGDVVYGGEPLGLDEIAAPTRAAGSQPFMTYARKKEDGMKMWNKIEARHDLLLDRPALHAAVLQITHPVTEQRMIFTAPLPADMKTTLQELRRQRTKSGPLPAVGSVVDLTQLIP